MARGGGSGLILNPNQRGRSIHPTADTQETSGASIPVWRAGEGGLGPGLINLPLRRTAAGPPEEPLGAMPQGLDHQPEGG